MSISRIYQAVPLEARARLRLDEKASHHLARVLRANVGDELTLFNGQGGEYLAEITHIEKKHVNVEIKAYLPREVESPIHIYLGQGIARGEKMDYIVQKAVELGVSGIYPLITERCNVRLDNEREEKRLQHWESVIISACEQSGRNRIPKMNAPQPLKHWVANLQADLRLVLSPHVATSIATATLKAAGSIVILVGPEGGLSDEEVMMTEQHGFSPIALGPRVMRTETASIAAISILQNHYGDMSIEH